MVHQNQESWISVRWFVEDRIIFCLLLRMMGEVDQAVEGVVEAAVHPSGVVGPNGYLKVVAKVGHEMEETLEVEEEQILAPDSAMVGVELDQHSAKEVVEHQMMVGVGVVVHVLQDPEEDMIQAHLEGVEVVGLQDEEDLTVVPLEEEAGQV